MCKFWFKIFQNFYCLFMIINCSRAMLPPTQNYYFSVEEVQQQNIDMLKETLPKGWKIFCETPVDEGVMSMYDGINPSDASLQLITLNNQSIELPIKALSEIRDFDINPKRKTLVYVNGYYTSDSYFDIHSHLKYLQSKRRDLNIIILDFAKDVTQLYYTVRHYITLQGYFVLKVLSVLIENGINAKDITLAGHSVGANIAALAANLYSSQTKGIKIGQLVAIDPAIMCHSSDVHIRPNISTRVVVIHGEGHIFGLRSPLGTIDIYPNGIGNFGRRKLQPGCETHVCSHMYAFTLFMEALIEGVMIPAVKCESWNKFRRRECNYNNTVAIGLNYPKTAKGLYFCMTQANPPFTYMEHGLKYKRVPYMD